MYVIKDIAGSASTNNITIEALLVMILMERSITIESTYGAVTCLHVLHHEDSFIQSSNLLDY